MKFSTYTTNELLTLTDRSVPNALDELCDRFDYFFLQADGTYSIPLHDGHTSQSLKMLGELLMKWKEQKRCLTNDAADTRKSVAA
jgi:hypothetical protein